jgi:hypothetical protein
MKMNYQIENAGTSGTFRLAGEVNSIKMAVAAARELIEDGYQVRIKRADSIWMDHDEIISGNGPYPLSKNFKVAA